MRGWPDLVDLAQRQLGLVERAQAQACGVSLSAFDKRAARERWERPQPGVVALPGSVDSHERRILAVVLATGHGAAATRWTAAYLYGLTSRLRSPLTVVVDHRKRSPVLQGAHAVRSRTPLEDDTRTARGVPVVSPARMLADLAPVTRLRELRFLAIDACQRRLLTPEEMLERGRRISGAPGATRLLTVAGELGQGRSDSALEWQLRVLLGSSDLPDPDPEPVPVDLGGHVAHVDIGWRRWRVGIECDGFRYHSERTQLDRDTARQNALSEAGWRLLRVTWAQLEDDPRRLVAQVRALLRAAGCDR